MLDLIAADRQRRCDEIRHEAAEQSAQWLRTAHRQARERLRRVLGDARERASQRVSAALAQRQTRERLALQSSASDFLEQALQRLPAALTSRWQQPSLRRIWMRMALEQARHALPPGVWRIEHAAGLAAEEIAALTLEAGDHTTRIFEPRPPLIAGARIFGNGNCVDASLPGLLSDRENLAAALLQAWETAP